MAEKDKNLQALSPEHGISHLIRAITKSFLETGIPSPQAEAEWLLAGILQTNRSGLHQQTEQRLSLTQQHHLAQYLTRRLQREPLQYILGACEFFGYEFQVSPAVLIPRPETELLVEKVVDLFHSKKEATLIDLGTGSGCIAITLALQLPNAQVVAMDISKDALKIAEQNAIAHGAAERIHFLYADMCDASTWHELPQFDCVISNPPYVLADERAELQPEVRDYEPAAALYVEGDGLQFYRAVIEFCAQHLRRRGFVACEMASPRSAAIAHLFDTSSFTSVEIISDYSGFERHVIGQKI